MPRLSHDAATPPSRSSPLHDEGTWSALHDPLAPNASASHCDVAPPACGLAKSEQVEHSALAQSFALLSSLPQLPAAGLPS
jgi:hypothetical protein